MNSNVKSSKISRLKKISDFQVKVKENYVLNLSLLSSFFSCVGLYSNLKQNYFKRFVLNKEHICKIKTISGYSVIFYLKKKLRLNARSIERFYCGLY